MNRENIKQKIIALCANIFQIYGADIDLLEYVDFVDDLGMDSITFITLIVEVEAAFDFTVPDDLLLIESFKNMNDIIQLVLEQSK